MIRILSTEQVKAAEANAVRAGISYTRLMENAGSACARLVRERFEHTDKRQVLVVCGKGKNGGDGFVAARKLFENGYRVRVLLALGIPTEGDAAEMLFRMRDLGISAELYNENDAAQAAWMQKADIILDAVFGTGLTFAPNARLEALFEAINASRAFVVSIDVPSGHAADFGELPGACVHADLTAAIMALKPSLVTYPAARYAGELKAVGIGVPEECYAGLPQDYTLTQAEIAALLPRREETANKGDFGKALMIAGSYEMPGAALLASSAAVHSGAGLVRLAFPDKAYAAIAGKIPETVCLPLPSNRFGRISVQSEKRLSDAVQSATAVLLGCGLGVDYDTKALVRSVLQNAQIPVVLDADGINAICGNIDILSARQAPTVLTPHPGEAARLLETTVADVQANRRAAALEICRRTNAVTVLKGARTVVAVPREENCYVNLTGNAGLATAGSGDVLAGMVVSLLCQGLPPKNAAIAAVYLHGAAGDAAAKCLSQRGLTPTDVIHALPSLLAIM